MTYITYHLVAGGMLGLVVLPVSAGIHRQRGRFTMEIVKWVYMVLDTRD